MMLITDGVSTTGGTDPTAAALSMAALAKDEGVFIIPGMISENFSFAFHLSKLIAELISVQFSS